MRRPAAALAAALVLTACGSDDGGSTSAGELRVSAAASLTGAFERYAQDLAPADLKLQFGGSGDLAAQIRQGARPDVFASADTALPEDLHEEGLLEAPVEFATNELVIATPAGSAADSIEDLEEPGLDVVIGAPGVPVGSYTLAALGRLEPAARQAILDNVRSEESDVKGIVGKLTQGAADAGFVYRSDVAAAPELRQITLPAALRPEVVYGAGVVEGAPNAAGALEFVDGLLAGDGADALAEAGFGPPPGR
ncbi:MAG TPA: molybdate ABC transporter substrate-binding protein [Solirubrobacterales bacterium]